MKRTLVQLRRLEILNRIFTNSGQRRNILNLDFSANFYEGLSLKPAPLVIPPPNYQPQILNRIEPSKEVAKPATCHLYLTHEEIMHLISRIPESIQTNKRNFISGSVWNLNSPVKPDPEPAPFSMVQPTRNHQIAIEPSAENNEPEPSDWQPFQGLPDLITMTFPNYKSKID